jgi:hypothetical protein
VNDTGPGVDAWIWARIFLEIAVIVCVVNKLAAAMSSEGTRHRQPVEQRLAVRLQRRVLRLSEVEVLPERRRVERRAVRRVDAVRHDEQVGRALVELLVALEVERVRCLLPHDLVDADHLVARPDEEDVRARRGREVDRAGERHRDPRLDVEPVERVQDVDVGAVRRAHRAVRLDEVDAETGDLARVLDRGEVAREGLARRGREGGGGQDERDDCEQRGAAESTHGGPFRRRWGDATPLPAARSTRGRSPSTLYHFPSILLGTVLILLPG